jgi:hypothetical protein
MSASQFYESQTKELKILASEFPQQHEKVLFPVDPGTIMATAKMGKEIMDLLETGQSFAAWFGKGKKDKLYGYLKKELSYIKQLLHETLNRLEDLKVLVKTEIRNLTIFHLESVMRMVDESYNTWWDRKENQEIRLEANECYLKLREYLNLSQNYGFGHFNTIWVAIVYQLMLLDYLNKPHEEVSKILSYHLPYFRDALNENLPGSITNAALQVKATIVSHANSFPEKSFRREYTERTRSADITYEETLIVTGNIYKGFTFQTTPPKQIGYERLIGDHGGGGGGHKFMWKPDVQLAVSGEFDQYKNYYTAAQSHYLNVLLPRLRELEAAKNGIDSYIRYMEDIINAKPTS